LKASNISSNTASATPLATVSGAKPPSSKAKPKDPGEKSSSKKRKADTEGSCITTNEDNENRQKADIPVNGNNPVLPPTFAVTSPMQNGQLAPSLFMQRHPPMLHHLPPYGVGLAPGLPGFAPFQMPMPDMPMYPPFGPAGFREPWSMPVIADTEFEEYLNQQSAKEQQQGVLSVPSSSEPLIAPPPPQEVVPAAAEEEKCLPEEKKRTPKPLDGGRVVVVD
jgi:hypothetical protein